MAEIKVSREDEIMVFRSNMVLVKHYTFTDLSNLLKNNLESINPSQIPDPIHRLSSGKNFLFIKTYLYRYDRLFL